MCLRVALITILLCGSAQAEEDFMEVQRCIWRCAAETGSKQPAYDRCVARSCDAGQSEKKKPTSRSNKDPASAEKPKGPSGTISGKLSYPSDFIPDLIICAEPVTGGKETCKAVRSNKRGVFSMQVSAGNYYVYAKVANAKETSVSPDYRAYFNEFVRCGSNASCRDRTKIAVEVKPGGMAKDVLPADWYDQATNSSPRTSPTP